jgi:DMSO/TMAO reductase YedYZ molybdopterin-dependent catalytic subunit
MKFNKLLIILSFFVLASLIFSFSCKKETAAAANNETANSTSNTEPAYLQLYEGLHITGTPIEVDIKNYRLKITGAVEKELNLTFDEVKKLPSVREDIILECPGFFTDEGYWTGVKIMDLLNMAGLKKEAKRVEFISIDGSYSEILALEEIKPDGFLIAYQFDDKEFSKYHGYPLRVIADGEPGSVWVKWLGTIKVLDR